MTNHNQLSNRYRYDQVWLYDLITLPPSKYIIFTLCICIKTQSQTAGHSCCINSLVGPTSIVQCIANHPFQKILYHQSLQKKEKTNSRTVVYSKANWVWRALNTSSMLLHANQETNSCSALVNKVHKSRVCNDSFSIWCLALSSFPPWVYSAS